MKKVLALSLGLLLAGSQSLTAGNHPCSKFAHGSYPNGAGTLASLPEAVAIIGMDVPFFSKAGMAFLRWFDDLVQAEVADSLDKDDACSLIKNTLSNRFVIVATITSLAYYGKSKGWEKDVIVNYVIATIYSMFGITLSLSALERADIL